MFQCLGLISSTWYYESLCELNSQLFRKCRSSSVVYVPFRLWCVILVRPHRNLNAAQRGSRKRRLKTLINFPLQAHRKESYLFIYHFHKLCDKNFTQDTTESFQSPFPLQLNGAVDSKGNATEFYWVKCQVRISTVKTSTEIFCGFHHCPQANAVIAP